MMEEWNISQLVDHSALKLIMRIYNTNKILTIPINRHLSLLDGDDSYENYVASDTTDPGNSLLIIAAFICLVSLIGLPLYVKFGKWLSARYKYCGNTSSSDSNIHNGDEDDNITNQVEQQGDDTPDLSFTKRCRKVLRSSVQFVLNTRKRGAHTAENVDGRREALERGIAREARESLYRQQQQTIVSPIDLTLGESVETTLDVCQINFDTSPQSHETKDSKGTEIVVVLDSQNNDGTNISTESDIEKGSGQPPVPTVSIVDNNSQPSSYMRKKLLFMRTIVKYDHETKRILHLAIPLTFSAIADTTSSLSE